MAMEARKVRGLEIVSDAAITREGNVWIIPSQTTPMKRYTVNLFIQTCTCPDFEENRGKCKHIYAAEYALQRESGLQLPVPPKDYKPKYRQEWHAYNAAQVNEKAKFQLLLHELCKGIEEPFQGMGRRRTPLADVIFASAFKVYSTVSGRRFNSDLRDAHEKGYLTKTPSYNSMFDYFGYQMLTPYLQQLIIESSLPLKEVDWDFAADSSGFSTGLYQRWIDTKWDRSKRAYGVETKTINTKDWVKVHLMCGAKTNIVTAAEVSNAHAGDSPYFKPLVETTSRNFPIQSVAADKG